MTTHTRLAEERLIKAALNHIGSTGGAATYSDLRESVEAYKASLPPVKARRGLLYIEGAGNVDNLISAAPAIEATDPVLERLGETAGVSRGDVRKILLATPFTDAAVDVIMQLIADAAPPVEGK